MMMMMMIHTGWQSPSQNARKATGARLGTFGGVEVEDGLGVLEKTHGFNSRPRVTCTKGPAVEFLAVRLHEQIEWL